jgi:hypothetical protein
MKKHLFLAALAGLLWAGTASAQTGGVLVKADTLWNQGTPDSSAVVNVSTASRLWLDFTIPPGPPYAGYAEDGTDTLIVLYVQVRERLSSAAGTDSTYAIRLAAQGDVPDADSANVAYRLHQNSWITAAAWSDTTVIPWNPRFNLISSTTAADSVIVGAVAPTLTTPGSSEFIVNIPIASVAAFGSVVRSVRVDLINVLTGAPFRAQFADFKWRMVRGPACIKLRVVLGRETW